MVSTIAVVFSLLMNRAPQIVIMHAAVVNNKRKDAAGIVLVFGLCDVVLHAEVPER